MTEAFGQGDVIGNGNGRGNGSMAGPVNPHIRRTIAPPVMAARRWLAETALPAGKPLINLSQAAPALPPPRPLREALARAVVEKESVHLYGPVLGLPALREALAADISATYGGTVRADQVAITAGCNEAFAAAIATLAAPGDNVILPVPWYFNHAMWLSQSGIAIRPLVAGPDLLPRPEDAARLIDGRTRAIVLVTPNNPTGVAYPPDLLAAFAALAARHGLALVLDETYRDFRAAEGPPHALFADPDWDEVVIHLYSFSKVFRLTGHRVGALVCAPARLAEAEKFLDTVTICPAPIGQEAALWGLTHLKDWLAGERQETLERAAVVRAAMEALPGWRLEGLGAYFAWMRPPFALRGEALARRLLAETGLLLLPGEMFVPAAPDPAAAPGQGRLRLAYANADAARLREAFGRLAAFGRGGEV